MTLSKGFVRNSATDAIDARRMDMAQVVANADGSPRVGVIGYPGAGILTALGTMNVAVAAAEFVVSRGKADGVVILTNDGTVNVPITAAPASNSRLTVIWVKQNDNTQGDANSNPVFGTTDGAAAATPVEPSIPTGALRLGVIRVYAGTTAANGGLNTLTNDYQHTAMRGGVVHFRTRTELVRWTNPVPGQVALVVDGYGATPTIWQWTGAGWSVQGDGLVLLGKVGFGNASQGILDGVFSPFFAFYKIRIQIRSASAAFVPQLQLRSGGTNASGGSDYYTQSRSSSGSTTATAGTNTGGAVPLTRASGCVQYMAEIDLHDPAVNFRTLGLLHALAVGGNTGAENTDATFQHNPTNIYDGFRVYSLGGQQLVGEMAVYGLVSNVADPVT